MCYTIAKHSDWNYDFMKTIGIIAEYNPFHNGHAYQIKKIKEETHADYVVIAMSGDFVQRGVPAAADKYCRTAMALSGGADAVFELPALWAVSSAEDFAMAGVTMFDKMGCIDGICFGAETSDLKLLSSIADFFATEPEDYQELLSSYIKEGMTFPAARAKALLSLFPDPSVEPLLNTPNNILAFEYLKAIRRRHSSLTPYPLKREGAGYHDTRIQTGSQDGEKKGSDIPTASATAIRALLSDSDLDFPVLAGTMPERALALLQEYLATSPVVTTDAFSSILGYQLLSMEKEELEQIYDITPDIANRIYKNRYEFHSFTQFCELNKSRDITYTRMSRILLHTILHITKEMYLVQKETDYIPYLRLLGFRKDATPFLSELKKKTSIPLLSRLSDAKKLLSEQPDFYCSTAALDLLQKDLFAADLYEQVKATCSKNAVSISEYSRKIILNDGINGFR